MRIISFLCLLLLFSCNELQEFAKNQNNGQTQINEEKWAHFKNVNNTSKSFIINHPPNDIFNFCIEQKWCIDRKASLGVLTQTF